MLIVKLKSAHPKVMVIGCFEKQDQEDDWTVRFPPVIHRGI